MVLAVGASLAARLITLESRRERRSYSTKEAWPNVFNCQIKNNQLLFRDWYHD